MVEGTKTMIRSNASISLLSFGLFSHSTYRYCQLFLLFLFDLEDMLPSGRRPGGTWEDKRGDALQVDCSIRRSGNFAFQQGRSSTNPGRRESGREWSSHPFKFVDCTLDIQPELGLSGAFQVLTSLLNLGIGSTPFQVPCIGKLQMLELPTRFIGSEILEPSQE